MFALLSLFTTATAAEFKAQLAGYQDLMRNEGLTEQELIVKKSYVQICSLNADKTNYSYAELAQILNVSKVDFNNLKSGPNHECLFAFACVLDRARRDRDLGDRRHPKQNR